MEPLAKISLIRKRMKNKPVAQRIYNFFGGEEENIINLKQMKEVKKIIDADYKITSEFIDNAINSAK